MMVRLYVARGATLWLVVRAATSMVLFFAGTNPLHLSGATVAYVVALTVAIALLETRRHHERAFIGNLGVSMWTVGALFAGPAILGEIALRLAAAAVL